MNYKKMITATAVMLALWLALELLITDRSPGLEFLLLAWLAAAVVAAAEVAASASWLRQQATALAGRLAGGSAPVAAPVPASAKVSRRPDWLLPVLILLPMLGLEFAGYCRADRSADITVRVFQGHGAAFHRANAGPAENAAVGQIPIVRYRPFSWLSGTPQEVPVFLVPETAGSAVRLYSLMDKAGIAYATLADGRFLALPTAELMPYLTNARPQVPGDVVSARLVGDINSRQLRPAPTR